MHYRYLVPEDQAIWSVDILLGPTNGVAESSLGQEVLRSIKSYLLYGPVQGWLTLSTITTLPLSESLIYFASPTTYLTSATNIYLAKKTQISMKTFPLMHSTSGDQVIIRLSIQYDTTKISQILRVGVDCWNGSIETFCDKQFFSLYLYLVFPHLNKKT